MVEKGRKKSKEKMSFSGGSMVTPIVSNHPPPFCILKHPVVGTHDHSIQPDAVQVPEGGRRARIPGRAARYPVACAGSAGLADLGAGDPSPAARPRQGMRRPPGHPAE